MRKIIMVVCVSVFLFALVAHNSFADESALTNVEFAELLVSTMGIELPEGTEDLSDAEYFDVIANILASRGIENFVGADPQNTITFGEMVNILYVMVGGTEELDSAGKIAYLVESGVVVDYGSPDATISLVQAQDILNNPAFADLVVEAYRPPAGVGPSGTVGAIAATPEEPEGDAVPGVVQETPAS